MHGWGGGVAGWGEVGVGLARYSEHGRNRVGWGHGDNKRGYERDEVGVILFLKSNGIIWHNSVHFG